MNKEDIIKHDINLLLIDNALEQNRLNFEAKKEEIYKNKLQEKDKELERYKNIVDEFINKFEDFIETMEYEKIYHSDLKELLNKLKELKGE